MEPTAFYLTYPSNNDFEIDRYKLYDCGDKSPPSIGWYSTLMGKPPRKKASNRTFKGIVSKLTYQRNTCSVFV